MNESIKISTTLKIGDDILVLVDKKIEFYKDIIQKTCLHIKKNKQLEIINENDVANSLDQIRDIHLKIQTIPLNDSSQEQIIQHLQTINNDFSSLFKKYGTEKLEDLLTICFGNNNTFLSKEHFKFELLKKYFHPISYNIFNNADEIKHNTELSKNNMVIQCYDISSSFKQFHIKVFGLKISIYNSNLKRGLTIFGTLDDIIIKYLNNPYIIKKISEFRENLTINNDENFDKDIYENFLSSLQLKDYFINETKQDIYAKYMGTLCYLNTLKQKSVQQLIKEFVSDDIYKKRVTLITLLLNYSNHETQYMAYLLYDLLSNDSSGIVDNSDQKCLLDSFPEKIKTVFNYSMKKIMNYTTELTNEFDMNKVSLEHQICLMKAPDSVKEKALSKLKELKSKTEDSSSKTRQYLDSLLKIPFGIYKREPILNSMNIIKKEFKNICIKNNVRALLKDIPEKDKYTSVEIMKYMKIISEYFVKNDAPPLIMGEIDSTKNAQLEEIISILNGCDKKKLIENVVTLNRLVKKHNKPFQIEYKSRKKDIIQSNIRKLMYLFYTDKDFYSLFLQDLISEFKAISLTNYSLYSDIIKIKENIHKMSNNINNIKNVLDESVYGHDKAKKEIQRIIAQWVNGNETGKHAHILGFEGPPGIGKTTLAKGLSNCLKDEDGKSRPFSLIALGGDSNASTLVGHGYTYVGSCYGKIVQILIDSKCMNPIILFDEVDKISKTVNGKEIIGVLTHLLDTTQNELFEDKYFSGINLDLSKALFILSYNDPTGIDRILLDRIHRVKFEGQSVEDKMIICKKHLLPELYKNMGLIDMVIFSDETLKFIIEEYTMESGVRKLKEKLYEIVGEINLNILCQPQLEVELPICVTIENIKTNYFKNKREIKTQKIRLDSQVGMINCLWANSFGVGGILSATAKFIHSTAYLSLKLTGLLDKMMEESFQISLTNAYSLLTEERKKEVLQLYNAENKYGIHLHMGDGSIEKSGTSAGIAITILFYSLLHNKKIRNDFAVTGEAADLNGNVGEIGALKTKIIYGIKAGVKNFIYPIENKVDFEEFLTIYKDNTMLDGINFYPINNIKEALDLIIIE